VDATSYLKWIGYHGSLTPTAETLRELHRAHLLAVPFENLDIHLGQPIVLDEARFFDKIVTRRRGGFCYELNGLFAWLLRALGFDVTLLSARVAAGDGSFGPEFDHLVLLVQLEERWLADVGFGESFRDPLRLDEPGEQRQATSVYRVVHEGEAWTMLERDGEGKIVDGYRFTLQPRRLADFADMCRYQQTSPESHFTQKRICSLATPEGRVSLSDRRLIITANGERREQELSSPEEYAAKLREHFGIELNE
jgi:N-hydroxyarylamine O-acetyltransferase